jgi:DNA mismatch repair protein MutS
MADTAVKIDAEEIMPAVVHTVTPMMKQFFAIKQVHQEYLLFYRMGDFYELFFDDAIKAADALDISLTHRGKHMGEPIPMCGVPHHSSDQYLHKLIKCGFKVAICEQLESPIEAKKRGAKSVVKRDVTRIVTAGTLTEDALLNSNSSNYLLAINKLRDEMALAWVDISTGDFSYCAVEVASLAAEIARINPTEILLPEKLVMDKQFDAVFADYKRLLTPYVASLFESSKGERKLKSFYGVKSLDAFGAFTKTSMGVCGALLEYVELTQLANIPRLAPPKVFVVQQYMQVDAATRANLELTRTTAGEYKGSLMHTLDKTVCNAGARLFYQHLSSPLMDAVVINGRLANVEFFANNAYIRDEIRSALRAVPDMERALSRLHMGRGSPRDLLAIREGLKQALVISDVLEHSGLDVADGVSRFMHELGSHDELVNYLQAALNDEVGFHARDGGFVRDEFDAKLDDYRNARANGAQRKEEMRAQYAEDCNIPTLKIKENNVIGMFVEVTPQHVEKIPDSYIHRQTLGSAARYTTPELKELESLIINAKGYALEHEMHLFVELTAKVLAAGDEVVLTAHALAGLDVAAANAELAIANNYTRPKVDSSLAFYIRAGRHPVVERMVDDNFISNDCDLQDEQRLWLITGPNMAGKSTFLRQNALIALMAQMGCYVPAESAHVGVIDRVFSRVGAADDLARGRSTFMVEMVETATILNHATEKSLVILDEIGRGTATYDGLSIAWAVVEYLHNHNKSRGLFATHYHEMTVLADELESLSCHTMKVREWKDDVIFLHEVMAGVADRSYGIHVGKLAGLPKAVVKRAEAVLTQLQKNDSAKVGASSADLPLFAQAMSTMNEPAEPSTVEVALADIAVDDLSPRQALDALYELKSKLAR